MALPIGRATEDQSATGPYAVNAAPALTASSRNVLCVAGVNHAVRFSLAASRFAINRPSRYPNKQIETALVRALINVRGL
jgi:hypothetical protein